MEPLAEVVRATGFRRLIGAQFVSSFGDWLATFALMALVLDISGSAAAVGGVLALRMLPAALAGPLVGVVGRRWGRRPLLVGLDAIRAAAVIAVPLVRSLLWVYSLALVIEVATVLAITARDASIRDTVERSHLPVANGIVLAATYVGIPLGAGAFTAIASLGSSVGGGQALAFWLDGATFVISMMVIRTIHQIPDRPDLAPETGGHVRLRDVGRVPTVRATLPTVMAASIGIGSMFSLGIAFVRDSLGATDREFGIMVLVFGLGAVAGLVLRQSFGTEGGWQVRAGVAGMGLVQVMMGLAPSVSLAFVLALVFGASGAFAIVSGLTLLQMDLRPADQLLALGAFHMGVRVALAVGALAAGLAADGLGNIHIIGDPARAVMVGSGALVLLSAAVLRSRIGTSAGEPSPGGGR